MTRRRRFFPGSWAEVERVRPEEMEVVPAERPLPRARVHLDVGQGGPGERLEQLAKHVSKSLAKAYAELEADDDPQVPLLRANNWPSARVVVSERIATARGLIEDTLQYLEVLIQCGRDMSEQIAAAQVTMQRWEKGESGLQALAEAAAADAANSRLAEENTDNVRQVRTLPADGEQLRATIAALEARVKTLELGAAPAAPAARSPALAPQSPPPPSSRNYEMVAGSSAEVLQSGGEALCFFNHRYLTCFQVSIAPPGSASTHRPAVEVLQTGGEVLSFR